MFTTSINTTVSTNLDFAYTSLESISASAKLSINETVPTGTSDVFVNFTFSTGSGVFLGMATDVALYPLVIKTNNPVTPTNVFSILSTNDLIKRNFSVEKDSLGNPITNITSLYVSNTGQLEASLRVDSLFDITPSI